MTRVNSVSQGDVGTIGVAGEVGPPGFSGFRGSTGIKACDLKLHCIAMNNISL